MKREDILRGNSRQYINVKDVELLLLIEQLLPYYSTFNKLLNDALRYGLPLLLDEKTGNKKVLVEEPMETLPPQEIPISQEYESALDPRVDEVIRLLKELIMNTSLNKSMLCGLFNEKEKELPTQSVLRERLSNGLYNHTPDCLFEEEIDMLKELRKDKEDG